ncbi:heme-binding protein [Nocardia sp. NBC_01377]|uniref:heme-binding protein n=1 Tax=Nocardia sp. NBC_01377 TaxID=2903595 RepID=UPI003248A020
MLTREVDDAVGECLIFAGGVPLTRDGVVVGGLGVSGGSGEQDQTVAEAGLAAL